MYTFCIRIDTDERRGENQCWHRVLVCIGNAACRCSCLLGNTKVALPMRGAAALCGCMFLWQRRVL